MQLHKKIGMVWEICRPYLQHKIKQYSQAGTQREIPHGRHRGKEEAQPKGGDLADMGEAGVGEVGVGEAGVGSGLKFS